MPPGVRLRGPRLTVVLPRDASRRRASARPCRVPDASASLCAPCRPFCSPTCGRALRAVPRSPPMPSETVALLFRSTWRAWAWRVRAVGQGYADGLGRAGPPLRRRRGRRRPAGRPEPEHGRTPPAARCGPRQGIHGTDAAGPLRGRRTDQRGAGPPRAPRRSRARRPGPRPAAQAHSADMGRRGFLRRTIARTAGQVWDRALPRGYVIPEGRREHAVGQRIGADEVVRGWMESQGHRGGQHPRPRPHADRRRARRSCGRTGCTGSQSCATRRCESSGGERTPPLVSRSWLVKLGAAGTQECAGGWEQPRQRTGRAGIVRRPGSG